MASATRPESGTAAASSMLNSLALHNVPSSAPRLARNNKRKMVSLNEPAKPAKKARTAKSPLPDSKTTDPPPEAADQRPRKLGRPPKKHKATSEAKQKKDEPINPSEPTRTAPAATEQPVKKLGRVPKVPQQKAKRKVRGDAYDFPSDQSDDPAPTREELGISSQGTKAKSKGVRAATKSNGNTNGNPSNKSQLKSAVARSESSPTSPNILSEQQSSPPQPSSARKHTPKRVSNDISSHSAPRQRSQPRLEYGSAVDSCDDGEIDGVVQGEAGEIGEEVVVEKKGQRLQEDRDEVEQEQEAQRTGTSKVNKKGIRESEKSGPMAALLGQDENFEVILVGARTSRKDKTISRGLMTKTVKNLNRQIGRARSLYDQIAGHKGQWPKLLEDLEKELLKTLDSIESHVDNLSEPIDLSEPTDSADPIPNKKASRMIQDLYVIAAPNMVFLSKAAMACRHTGSDPPYTYNGLKEVLHVQTLTLRLCGKISGWKAKPLTTRPIVRPIKSQVKPYLEKMIKVFQEKLHDLYVQQRRKENAETSRTQDEGPSTSEDPHENWVQQTQAHNQRISDDIKRENQAFRRKVLSERRRPTPGLKSRATSNAPSKLNEDWNGPQDQELIVQLLSKDSRNLPSMLSHW